MSMCRLLKSASGLVSMLAAGRSFAFRSTGGVVAGAGAGSCTAIGRSFIFRSTGGDVAGGCADPP